MKHPDNIDEVYAAIQRWDELRKLPFSTIPYFDKFTSFVIDKEQLNNWVHDDRIKYLHFYLGINENRDLVFYLIDNNNDKEGLVTKEKIFLCSNRDFDVESAYHAIVNSKMSSRKPNEIHFRKRQGYSLLWGISNNDYLTNYKIYREGALFYAFGIEMEELRIETQNKENKEYEEFNNDCYVSMGLSLDNEQNSNSTLNKYNPHIVLWNLMVEDGDIYIADLSYPIPPFKGDDTSYQLYKQAIPAL